MYKLIVLLYIYTVFKYIYKNVFLLGIDNIMKNIYISIYVQVFKMILYFHFHINILFNYILIKHKLFV